MIKSILIDSKEQYICLVSKITKKIYYLCNGMDDGQDDSPFKMSKDNLNFINPFDMWDCVYFSGTDKDVILKDLKGEYLKKYDMFFFSNEEEVIKFIKENEPQERKELIERYKDSNIVDIPLGDLKKMGIEIPIC